ncbi:NAD(P)-dependent oxidoreductase [Phyllobacterium sp. SB3]|uniref:NAD-dependent epimerase/dehydratase family protein n=1 Tax=Phyllobacterium sp. SB3 TaxID=3156073 RepID=UPI0032AF617A
MHLGKVAITGGSGRLGQFVVDRLKKVSEVTVIDLRAPQDPDVEFIESSILDFAGLERAFVGQDYVIHLAAVPNPRSAPADITFNTNVQGTWNVLQAAENAGVKRVAVASSDAATGLHYNPENWGIQYLPVDESHPLKPGDFYGLSKEITEMICLRYAQRGKVQVGVIRPTHIVFESEYPELEARGADVNNYHIWTYVDPKDVAQAFELVLAKRDLVHDIFFISAADTLSNRPTLEMIKDRMGTVPEVRNPGVYEANPFASVLDITHARNELGYEPESNWREMFAKANAVSPRKVG